MSVGRPWKICDCPHCEAGNANKASVRNAHLRTLLEMPPDRLLEIARLAYRTGDVIGAATHHQVDEGVVSRAQAILDMLERQRAERMARGAKF